MSKVLFVIHTEYHLLFSLKIIAAFHSLESDDIVLCRFSPRSTQRLNQTLHFEGTGLDFKSIIYENKNYKDRDLKSKLDVLIDYNPDILYVFNEAQKIFPYVFDKLKRRNTRIVLCPDGAKVYCNNTPLKERLLQFVYGNIFLWTNRIPSFLSFPKRHYAYRNEIDDVIVEDAPSYQNHTEKKVIEITPNDYSRDVFISLADKIFGFSPSDVDVPTGSILWIDQPVEGMEISKRRFLDDLLKRYPQKTIFIKPHPHSFLKELSHYENVPGYKVLRINMPVELMMDNLVGVNIISAFSTAMFYNNPTCNYYWVSALFKELPSNYTRIAAFNHIHVVNSFDQIKCK